jgi:fatty-acyl-CoA synthase
MSSLRRLRDSAEFLCRFVPPLVKLAIHAPERATDFSGLLDAHIQRRPDKPALIGESGSLSWLELDRFANRVAAWARAAGLVRGDVVSLSMENRPEYIATWLGLSRIGVVTALQNTHLSGERLAHCLREAGARHWIIGEELVDEAASALVGLEERPALLVASERCGAIAGAAAPDPGPDSLIEEVGKVLPGAQSFDALLAECSEAPVDAALRESRRGGDGLFLIYTSGTTGLPKAARVSHSKAIAAGLVTADLQALAPSDRMYVCLPLYHSAGGMMAAGAGLFSGAGLVIARRFSTSRFWSDCTQHEVTCFQYIGELCRYLLNSPRHPDEQRHRIRTILGNGLRPEVWGPFQERFGIKRIVEFYGATEGNLPLFNIPGRLGAVGYVPGPMQRLLGLEILKFDVETEALVRDAQGRCVRSEVGEAGELAIRITRTTRFEGYTNDAASEKKVLRDAFEEGDAFFLTGDLLRVDAEGFYYFVDRIGDTFRWKGENVSTNEVAEVLSVVGGVEEANVYGVEVPGADGRAGMAALVTNTTFDLEDFGRQVSDELAGYARPLFVRILPEMETTGTFKHRKVDLVREGFDPVRVADPLFFLDPEKVTYVPLDAATVDRITRGEIRI